MLCQYCKDFDYDLAAINCDDELPGYGSPALGYPHHHSWRDLQASAKAGCNICEMVIAQQNRDFEAVSELPRRRIYVTIVFYSWELRVKWQCEPPKLVDDIEPTLEIVVKRDDPLSRLFPTKMVNNENIFSDEVFSLIKMWFSTCKQKHWTTCFDIEYILQTRVIRVGSEWEEPRLVVPGETRGKWAALSHCWGDSVEHHPPKTTLSSLKRHCLKLPFSSLPLTFQHAIIITRKLGLEYLWIDSLCILQDSEEDWLAESRKMGEIYKLAYITLAAEAAANASEGILGLCIKKRSHETSLPSVKCHSKSHALAGNIFLRQPSFPEKKIDTFREMGMFRGKLSQRVWTLQEDLVSRRILWFTDHYIHWRCPERYTNETVASLDEKIFSTTSWTSFLSIPIDPNFGSEMLEYHHARALEFWHYNALHMYMMRRLSFAGDKMIAISGIARELQGHLQNSDYKAGLWSSDMERGLLWEHPWKSESRCVVARCEEYIAPSWSWACLSVDTELLQPTCGDLRTDGRWVIPLPPFHIEDVVVENIDDDPFGKIVSAKLEIEGEFREICSCKLSHKHYDVDPCKEFYRNKSALRKTANPMCKAGIRKRRLGLPSKSAVALGSKLQLCSNPQQKLIRDANWEFDVDFMCQSPHFEEPKLCGMRKRHETLTIVNVGVICHEGITPIFIEPCGVSIGALILKPVDAGENVRFSRVGMLAYDMPSRLLMPLRSTWPVKRFTVI